MPEVQRVSYLPESCPTPPAIVRETEHWELHPEKVLKPDSSALFLRVHDLSKKHLRQAVVDTGYNPDIECKGRLIGHNTRVAVLALLISDELERSEQGFHFDKELAAIGGGWHDSGKYRQDIHDVIFPSLRALPKDDPRFARDWELIQEHPRASANVVNHMFGLPERLRESIAGVTENHHERMDGRGYYARDWREVRPESWIVQAADSIDVMSGRRGYKGPPKSWGEIENELKRCSGTQFHPTVARAAIRSLQIEENRGLFTYAHKYMH